SLPLLLTTPFPYTTLCRSLYEKSAPSKSSCPSPDAFLRAYQGADNIIVITITGALSGSHNSAQIAKQMLLEEHPNVNIHVIDSRSEEHTSELQSRFDLVCR